MDNIEAPPPNPAPLLQLIEAFRASKAMFVAVSLGLFDHLESRPCQLAELASRLQCQVAPLERLLDSCVGLGLLQKDCAVYRNEPIASVYLSRSSPNTLVGYITYSNEVLYPLWSHLEEAVRHGSNQWRHVTNGDGGIFDQFFRTPESMETFLKGMHGLGILSSPSVVSAFDLSQFRRFVDVGGATGHLAVAACERYPNLNAIVFDLPRVIEAARLEPSAALFADRIEWVRGDMFSTDQIPEGDLFGLGRILHDWDDAKAESLLRAISNRVSVGGGILLAEKLLKEDKSGPTSAHLQSLNMLVCTEGKERTLAEYRVLLERAGFTDVRGHFTGTPLDAIFAVKA
jgi:acetylserotonin N-methyltransferase